MDTLAISAENAKKKYPILTDYDLRISHKNTNGLYDSETVRRIAQKKALKGGQEMNRIETLLWKPVISQYRQDRRLDFWRIVRDRCYEIDREYPQLTAEEGSYLAFWADKTRKKDQRNDFEIDSILMRYGNQV